MGKLAHALELILQPVALLWLAAIAVSARLILRRRLRSAALLGSAAILLWIFGATPLSPRLAASLESPYVIPDWSKFPESDAVLMLGGTLSPSPPDILKFEVGGAFDRAITAVELVKKGKSRALVFSGGGNPADPNIPTEVSRLKSWVQAWNLVQVPVFDLGACANTREEAEKTRILMQQNQWKQITLVTSAGHMKRAASTFTNAGVNLIPAACDFAAYNETQSNPGFFVLPEERYLKYFGNFLHEYFGIIYYRLRGWIR